ncbi:MAG: amidohydrolase family protein [Desulfobulbaceae bacterium]|nr:amidohydrolase family protein [Desulfobulbaceae bacterium]
MGAKWFRLFFLVLIFWFQESAGVWAQTGNITAFAQVNLVPMTAETIIPNQTVLVNGSRIIAIGPSKHIDIPKDASIINGSNAYLVPGLSDMHMHTKPNWLSGDWPVSPFYLYLASGVTTIRDFGPKGRSPDNVLHWREGIKKGELIGPTIYTCGEQLRGYINNPEEMVRIQKAKSFDFIKLYSYLSHDEFHRAVSTAKEIGIYTAGHIPFQVGLEGVLSEGMDEIAHIEELFWEFVDFDRSLFFNSEQDWMSYVIRATFQQYEPYLQSDTKTMEAALDNKMEMAAKKVKSASIPVCTTLFLDEVIVEKLFEPETFLSKPENKYLPKSYLDAFRQNRGKHQMQFLGGEAFAPFKRRADLMLFHHLEKAGVPLILGTDAGTGWMGLVPGLSVHKELRVLTRNGFTPYEAIKTATVNAAIVVEDMLGKGDFGTIEVGKRADLLLVDGNPLKNIEVLSIPQGVMAAGRWYDKAALQKMITPGISVTGAIHHVYEAEKYSSTYFEILIGKTFTGKLPGAIESITVFGPKGKLPIDKDDFTYLSGLRDFWIKIPGTPAIGTYRFEITSHTNSGAAFDYQYVVKQIPIPDSSTFFPKNNDKLDSVTPTFTWQAVKTELPLFYRLVINQNHGGRVYSTRHVKNMVSHTVPSDVLKSGQTYRWRIRIADSDDWLNIQNRSHSNWNIFHVP